MTEPSRRTVVPAGTHQQFRNWCYENERNPRGRDLICIIPDLGSWQRLCGLTDFDVVRVGTWGSTYRCAEIEAIVEHRQTGSET